MREVYELLKMLTEKYQPTVGAHSVTFQNDALTITLYVDGMFYPFEAREDADYDKPAGIVFQEIVDAMDILLSEAKTNDE
jgi:hypothetical protein